MDLTAKLTSLAEALVDSATTALVPNGPGMPAGDAREAKEAVQALVLVLGELRRASGEAPLTDEAIAREMERLVRELRGAPSNGSAPAG